MENRLEEDFDGIIHKSSFISCLVFFIAHIAYIIFFLSTSVFVMVYVNIGSVLIYALMFLLIRIKLYTIYVIISAIEIALYMTFGAVYLGPQAGFQICLIGLSSLIFFAGFFSKFGRNRIHPVFFSIIYMLLFVFLYFWSEYNGAMLVVDPIFERILYVAHIAIVFGFSTTFLAILTTYTANLEKKVWKESETDKLTGLANRKGLANYFDKIGDQKNNYLMVIFDIDDFKALNDLNGHLCGDYILKEVSNIAKENSKDDFVSRWGGEEFVVIAKKLDNMDDTINKIDRIRKTIDSYEFNYNGKVLKTTITIGVADYKDSISLEEWITIADEKLYYGKHHGKNQITV
ncbi:MAG: diguanylate cyclase [Acholeplasmatales bacterium]|nr:diguanylate cyclase [Acholeplasmatales bacterium]